jgi:hypothetical protein
MHAGTHAVHACSYAGMDMVKHSATRRATSPYIPSASVSARISAASATAHTSNATPLPMSVLRSLPRVGRTCAWGAHTGSRKLAATHGRTQQLYTQEAPHTHNCGRTGAATPGRSRLSPHWYNTPNTGNKCKFTWGNPQLVVTCLGPTS